MIHNQRKKRFSLSKKLLNLILIIVTVVVLFPIFWTLLTSLKDRLDIACYPPLLLFKPTLESYKQVFFRDNFIQYFINSLVIGVSSTLISLGMGSLTAYSMSRYKTGGKNFSFWVLSMRMLPPIAIILPVYILMSTLRWLGTYQALVAMHVLLNLPFAVWLMKGFFDEIPTAVDEAALIDGCSPWSVYWRIVIPIAMPGLLATAIFCLITSWNEFLFALLLSGIKTKTLPVATAGYITDREICWGPMATVAITASAPIILFMVLIQKHLVRGLSYGAIK